MCNQHSGALGPAHPMQCIMPPYMLRAIVENGTQQQRQWAITTLAISEQFRGQRIIFQEIADAVAGAIVSAAAQKERKVYNAQNQQNLPGQLVRSEGDPPSGDAAVDEAYDGSGATYDLFREVYNRNSIDNRGMVLNSTVHYGVGYDNAFWNGQQMVYGDGDADLPPSEQLFNRFTIALDIIGHELTHGVTQFEAKLVYRNQPGALNESMSDVFGSLVKQRVRSQTPDQADWIIGEGLFTANVNGVGIRSMKAPGTAYNDPVLGRDPQPAHMNDYKDVTYDNGGVHINSGIPNHAFYVVAREIGGYAWEKAGLIWYNTLANRLDMLSDFQQCADATFAEAGALYGASSLEQQAVRTGWAAVGITVAATTPTPTPIPMPEGCRVQLLRLMESILLPGGQRR